MQETGIRPLFDCDAAEHTDAKPTFDPAATVGVVMKRK